MKKWICLPLTVLLLGTLAIPVRAEEVSSGETPPVHTWDGGIVTTKATCIAAGVKIVTCTGCGTTKTEDIPATGVLQIAATPRIFCVHSHRGEAMPLPYCLLECCRNSSHPE